LTVVGLAIVAIPNAENEESGALRPLDRWRKWPGHGNLSRRHRAVTDL
jgi:hypothetical protein